VFFVTNCNVCYVLFYLSCVVLVFALHCCHLLVISDYLILVLSSLKFMALNGLLCADVPLRKSRFLCTVQAATGATSVSMVTCDTVSSASSSGMEIGRQFDSAKAVMEYIADFSKRHFHPLRRSSCTTVEAYNRKVRRAVNYELVGPNG